MEKDPLTKIRKKMLHDLIWSAPFHGNQQEFAEAAGLSKGSGRGFFGFSDGNSCTIKKAATTPHQPSANAIRFACQCLYDDTTSMEILEQGPDVMCSTSR